MKKQFLILFTFISVLALSQVPQRFNKVIVTGDITSPKFIKTGSNADSVLLGNGSARAISTIKTDTVSLSNRINTKATGNGTSNGTNTGDETLTSIKTKLGAATAVSDGYLKYQDWSAFNNKVSNATHTGDVTGSTALTLATVNSNVGTFNSVTINAKGLATAGSNVSYLTGITSGQVTTALGYTPKPTFTENTAFNKNFGTTAGTVLEGRTFGTAAGSAVGDFIQNQNSTVQSANMWISGVAKIETSSILNRGSLTSATPLKYSTAGVDDWFIGQSPLGTSTKNLSYYSYGLGGVVLDLSQTTGAATFSSTVNSTGFLLNGNNLTSSLTTNYIPMWNGSAFVNSGISNNSYWGVINVVGTGSTFDWGLLHKDTSPIISIKKDSYDVGIPSTTPSTSPTTGALVVGGGVGADHVRANNFYGNGSNLTGVQLPVTLTTNGTSGAATKVGDVINIPNYSSNSVNQTLTTVNGSTGGDIVGSMPFQTANYKKVIIYVNFVSGNATYTFPTQFNTEYNLHTNTLGVSYVSISVNGTSATITGATSATGVLIIEGY